MCIYKKSAKVLSLYCYKLMGKVEEHEEKKTDGLWLYSG